MIKWKCILVESDYDMKSRWLEYLNYWVINISMQIRWYLSHKLVQCIIMCIFESCRSKYDQQIHRQYIFCYNSCTFLQSSNFIFIENLYSDQVMMIWAINVGKYL